METYDQTGIGLIGVLLVVFILIAASVEAVAR